MDLKELNTFIDWEEKRLEEYYNNKEKDELTMAMGFKVIEEIGELFDEILKNKGYQRKDKLEKLNKDEIKKEFADVFFTVLLLAKRFNIDIEEAIQLKKEEIQKRIYIK